jgi:hypothetical protein
MLTFGLVLTSAVAAAYADDALSIISKRLAKHDVICANFTQTKSLKALNRPLVSLGKLVSVTGAGVLWQVREPFPTQVLVKGDALIRWDEKGLPVRTTFGQTPIFNALSRIFLAVFTGSLDRLRDSFEITSDTGSHDWRLTLIPRDKSIAAKIAAIRISGDRYVNELLITEGRGDKTDIQFSDVIGDTCPLSDAEKGYLAH